MNGKVVQVMERRLQLLQKPQELVRDALRLELEVSGLTAKELSALIKERLGVSLDYRTIQNAAGPGNCSLETYFVLCAFFGWDFNDQTMTPFIGACRIASLEKEIADEKAIISAREAKLARLKAAQRARSAQDRGVLRLVGEEDRAFPA